MKFVGKILLLFLLLITIILLCLIFIPSISENLSDLERSFPEYTDKIEYIDGGFGDFTKYKEFYYEKTNISEFESNAYFKKVDKDDIVTINDYFIHFENSLQFFEHKENYKFNKSQIKENDYFYIDSKGDCIYDNYDVYYVDMKTCIMYYIHSNI